MEEVRSEVSHSSSATKMIVAEVADLGSLKDVAPTKTINLMLKLILQMNNNAKRDEEERCRKRRQEEIERRQFSESQEERERRREEKNEVQPIAVAQEDPVSRVNDKLLRAMKPISVSDDLETFLHSMERTLEIC